MRYFLIGFLALFASMTVCAYADVNTDTDATATPPGFSADASKPASQTPTILPQADVNPVSSASRSAWNRYKQPICECIQGDTILPAENNNVLSFLFGNAAYTNATMSIQGWKNSRCLINFSEGTLVKSCQFTRATLRDLMNQLLEPSQFEPNSKLAQSLASECR